MVLVTVAGFLFLFSLIFEGTFVSVPFFVVSVVLTAVIFRSQRMIVTVFLLSILYDVITLSQIGQTSMFSLLLIVLILLYERKFETKTLPFVFFMSLIASSLYLLLFGSYAFFIQLAISVLYGTVAFFILERFHFIQKERQ